MSSSKSSAKNTQAQTSSKSSGKQASQTVEVGGGLLDRTTFKMYDMKKEMTVHAAATTVSDLLTSAVYQRYGLVPPSGDDEEVADCWVFPTGVDYNLPLSALPPAEPDIPPLMVLVTLRADTPMMNRVFATTKENLAKQNDAGTSGELAVMLAEFKAMKKDMNDVKTSNDELKTSNGELKAEVRGLKASNSELKAEVRGLKAGNSELRASNSELRASNSELRASNSELRASNSELKAEVRGLKASNDELKAEVRGLKASDDQHNSHVLSLEDKIATLEAEMVSRKDENGGLKRHIDEVRNELTRYINMITPLLLRILVDKARHKVLQETAFRKWGLYYQAFPNQQACQDDVQRLTSLPSDVAGFISSPNSKVRKDGNKAAHNAEEGDIRDAVERTNATRHLLECTLEYVFPSGDAEENEEADEEDEHHEDDEEAEEV